MKQTTKIISFEENVKYMNIFSKTWVNKNFQC